MVGLPDGEKTLRMSITVQTQYRRMTDGQTDILPRHSLRYAYASRGKNDMHIQLSLSLHFYLFYLLLNSCDGNDAKQRVFLSRLSVALKRTRGPIFEKS